ncbi:MAG TPA: UvrD-helicase domain-containing protein, partial [Methanocorpusculum sp.]|nr:UvrD-helicase domain-containing protein [Methanocorpusculum sp.]
MNEKLTAAQEKALFMGESICVTAGAGTGKTFLLTMRYLASLKYSCDDKKISAADILALTYTDKAAAEMRIKIGKALQQEAMEDPALVEVWESFSRCNISTFHGFCLSLLKEFAYEAGLYAGFTVMDELDTHELVTGTIKEMMEKPPAEFFEDAVTLYNHLKNKTTGEYIRFLLNKWEKYQSWFDELERDPTRIIAVWQQAWEELIQKMHADLSSNEQLRGLMNELRGYTKSSTVKYFQ